MQHMAQSSKDCKIIIKELNKLLADYRYARASYSDFGRFFQSIPMDFEIYVKASFDYDAINLTFDDIPAQRNENSFDLRSADDRERVITILRNKYYQHNGTNYIVHKNVLGYACGYGLKYMQEYDCAAQYRDFYNHHYVCDLNYWKSIANQGPKNNYYDLANKILSRL